MSKVKRGIDTGTRFLAIAFLLTLMGCATATCAYEKGQVDVKNISVHHVHVIGFVDGKEVDQGSGTSVFVPGMPGAVLTAAHVCATEKTGVRSFEIYDTNDEVFVGVVMKSDEAKDLCLIAAPGLKALPAIISSRKLIKGDRVDTVVGIFFTDGVVPVVEHLFVGQHKSGGHTRQFLVPAMYPGDSGGGVWRGQELVGVTIGILDHPSTKQGVLGVIVSLADVRSFLGLK